MPAPIASAKNKRPATSLTRRGLRRAVGATLFVAVFVIADTASAQGPLRRLGDRIRERAGAGPVVPGVEPGAPAPPLGRRPLFNGPLRNGPAGPASPGPAAPGPAAPGPLAGPVTPPPASRPSTGATRSANYNRAAQTAQRMPSPAATGVQQSSAWESREDFRGTASRDTVQPQTRASQAASPSESISSVPPIAPATSRARLGVVVDTPPVVTPDGLPPRRSRGALVSEVQPDSAAEVAGIAVGDLIVGVNGTVITSVQDLTDHLQGYEPGDEARFQVARNDQLLTADVTFAGPDGIAIRRPTRQSPVNTSGSTSIMNGLGAAIGGLFGGPASGTTPDSPQTAADNAADNSPAISPETVRNSLPESLPPPAPEKDAD